MVSFLEWQKLFSEIYFHTSRVSTLWTWPLTEYPTGKAADGGCPQALGGSRPEYEEPLHLPMGALQLGHGELPASKVSVQHVFKNPGACLVIIFISWFNEG